MCRYARTTSLLFALSNSSNWSRNFPEAFFMQTTAFFNAALRGAFAASAPAVAYARQLLHVRYVAARGDCEIDGEDPLKWGLLDDVKTVPRIKRRGDSNIRFKCTLIDEPRHETPLHPTPRPRGDTWSTTCAEHPSGSRLVFFFVATGHAAPC